MKLIKSSLLVKLVILILVVYATVTLVKLCLLYTSRCV